MGFEPCDLYVANAKSRCKRDSDVETNAINTEKESNSCAKEAKRRLRAVESMGSRSVGGGRDQGVGGDEKVNHQQERDLKERKSERKRCRGKEGEKRKTDKTSPEA